MMKLILASNNAHKLEEFSKLVEGLGGIDLISQREAGCSFEVDENGTTFEENSYLKAIAVTEATGLPAIADDSGLVVDALGGEPGIYSARYGLGHEASDEQRYRYLLSKLGDEKNRSARFVCCICCTFPNGDVLSARGECEGEILYGPAGANGFGYDPIFKPHCCDMSMAEISPEEKNRISHRANAMVKFAELFKEYLRNNTQNGE